MRSSTAEALRGEEESLMGCRIPERAYFKRSEKLNRESEHHSPARSEDCIESMAQTLQGLVLIILFIFRIDKAFRPSSENDFALEIAF
jgi:hypothetical protein